MKLYQTCPRCGFSIKIKREKVECWGTPYYYWEFADEVECPNCGEEIKTNVHKKMVPLGIKYPLFAWDIGMPLPKHQKHTHWLRSKAPLGSQEDMDLHYEMFKELDEKRNNYVAIAQNGIQFLQHIVFSYSLFTNTGEFCNVYTNVDFEGNVETGIK